MASNNLDIVDLQEGQVDKVTRINTQVQDLEDAITELLPKTITSSNALTLTTLELQRNFLFDLNPDGGSPPTAQITVTVPSGTERGAIAFKNDTLQDAKIEITSQPDTAPVISAGQAGIVIVTGTNVRGLEAGVANFIALTDTPSTYAGQGTKKVRVNAGATALEFVTDTAAEATNLQTLKRNYKGAVVNITSNKVIPNNVDTLIPWDEAIIDTTFTNDSGVTVQKFWLGIDLNLGTVTPASDQAVATAHGMTTGDGPLRLTTSAADLPAGLSTGTNYWIIRVDNNTIQFATTRANALAGTQIDITDAGTGTHTLQRSDRIIVPEGVTRVRITANYRIQANATGNRFFSVQKNESLTFDLRPEDSHIGTSAITQTFNLSSHVLNVVGGDFFGSNVFQNSGGNLNADATGERTNFSLEVIESDIVLPFPQVMVEKPFSGALLKLTSNQVNPALSPTGISWDAAEYDTNFEGSVFAEFVTNPSRITIPAGVTRVQLKCRIAINAGFTADNFLGCEIRKNGSATYIGAGELEMDAGSAVPDYQAFTSVLDVIAGDYFEVMLIAEDTTFTIASDRCWFSVEVKQSTQVLTFPGVTVERPQIGALVHLTANEAISASTNTVVPWDAATYDTGYKGTNFAEFVTNPSRFTIPTGITKVRLTAQVFSDDGGNNAAPARLGWITKNGQVATPETKIVDAGLPFWRIDDAAFNDQINLVSAVINVVKDDYFELVVHFSSAVDLGTVSGNKASWFSIEVVETTDAAFPPEEVEFFINGTPVVSDVIYQKVASRRFSVNDELLTSQAYAITAPSGGAVAFDVQKNAVSVGTITFADTSNTATFVTSGGSQVDFDLGDRLTVHSPANLQSMADISFNIFAFRT